MDRINKKKSELTDCESRIEQSYDITNKHSLTNSELAEREVEKMHGNSEEIGENSSKLQGEINGVIIFLIVFFLLSLYTGLFFDVCDYLIEKYNDHRSLY